MKIMHSNRMFVFLLWFLSNHELVAYGVDEREFVEKSQQIGEAYREWDVDPDGSAEIMLRFLYDKTEAPQRDVSRDVFLQDPWRHALDSLYAKFPEAKNATAPADRYQLSGRDFFVRWWIDNGRELPPEARAGYEARERELALHQRELMTEQGGSTAAPEEDSVTPPPPAEAGQGEIASPAKEDANASQQLAPRGADTGSTGNSPHQSAEARHLAARTDAPASANADGAKRPWLWPTVGVALAVVAGLVGMRWLKVK